MAPLTPSASFVDASSVAVRYSTRAELFSHGQLAGFDLSLFVPTSIFPPVDGKVRLYVSLGDCNLHWELTGTVKGHRMFAWNDDEREGIFVRFEGEEKRIAVRVLAQCGEPEASETSRSIRVAKQLPCTVGLGRQNVRARVLDLSSSGAFVEAASPETLEVGSDVVLELRRGFMGIGARRLTARVVWRGEKRGAQGFGAQFVGEQERIAPTLRHYFP